MPADIAGRLQVLERDLRTMIEPGGPVEAHFDEYQATTLRCVVNALLDVCGQVREIAGRLDSRPAGED